jgi:hypothetical protein
MIRFLQDVIRELEGQQESEAKPARRTAGQGSRRSRKATVKRPRKNGRTPATPPSMLKPTRRRRKTAV